MEITPSFQDFISDQLAAACSCIISEYERLQSEQRRTAPAEEGEGGAAPSEARAPALEDLPPVRSSPCASSTISTVSAESPVYQRPPRSRPAQSPRPPQARAEEPGVPELEKRRPSVDSPASVPSSKRMSDFSDDESGTKVARKWARREGVCIFDPSSAWYRTWQNAIALVVVFSVFFTPVRFAFEDRSSWGTYVDYCIDVLFGFDILLTFNVAGTTRNGCVWDRWSIAKNYALSLRFLVDLVAVVPASEFASLCGAKPGVSEALNLLRLLRANRILILFRELQKSVYFNLMGVVVAKFVLFIVLCTHTAGCVFYAAAGRAGFGDGTWVAGADPELPNRPWHAIYIHMLYWAVGTYKAGPAHGPIFPVSESEMLFSCFTMMINIFLQTYLVSSMSALLTTADVRTYEMRNRLRQLAEFSERYGLTRDIRGEIQSYIRFKFKTNQELDQLVLGGLPEIYRQRINHALHDGLMSSLFVFTGCNKIFMKQLHGALESRMHMQGHEVVHVDDPSTELQILAEGEVDMAYQDAYIESRFGGECLTAVPFVCKVSQPFGVKTRKVCRILSLGRSAWDAIANAFPEDVGQVEANLLVFCSDRRGTFTPGSPGALAYDALVQILESHLARERESAISSLCFAAASGDAGTISRILRSHTADCADYDNRSPLHIAASKGQMSALELLTAKSANVNIVDNFGRTPLMEAVRSRQDAAARYLHEQGASLGFSAADAQSSHTQAGELCEAASDAQLLWYLSALIRYGANANAADYDARTPLHVASAAGNRAAVELLLGCEGVDASPSDRFGRTPLMEAVRHGHEPCARLLRARGALHGFIDGGKQSKDADQGHQTKDTNAVHAGQELCQAAFANQTAYLHSLIVHCGIDPDAADYDLRTALMLACAEGNTDAAVTLVQLGADVNRKDRWGHTALAEAKSHGHADLAATLRQLSTARGQRRPG